MPNLERCLEEDNATWKLEIFNDQGNLVGFLYTRMTYADQQGQKDLVSPARFRPPSKRKITIGHNKKKKKTQIFETAVKEVWTPTEESGADKENRSSNTDTSTVENQIKSNPTELAKGLREASSGPNYQGRLLPTWNLSTDRIRFISCITGLEIQIHSIKWQKKALEAIVKSTQAKPHFILRSRAKAAKLPMAKDEPLSFFASFILPPSKEANNFCSRKLQSESVVFNQNCTQNLRFTPELLDAWWTSDLKIRILFRTLKERESTLVGEASIGLKHLLIDKKNSSGDILQLPIYMGQQFFAEHKLNSEIVGDLLVSFSFLTQKASSMRPIGRPVSPQPAHREGDDSPEEKVPEIKHPVPKSRPVVQENIVPSTSRVVQQPTKTLMCLLEIPEGRNFTLENHSGAPNLYVSCRFLTSGDSVQSQVCWNSTRPMFNLHHYVPLVLDQDFLLRCENNFLAIEVWNRRENDNDIVGVSMIPLHQFYLSFKVIISQNFELYGFFCKLCFLSFLCIFFGNKLAKNQEKQSTNFN